MTAERKIRQSPDLDGDGKDDLLFRNISNGQVYGIEGDGTGSGWRNDWISHYGKRPDDSLKAIGDLDGDGRADMVWETSTGYTYVIDTETSGWDWSRNIGQPTSELLKPEIVPLTLGEPVLVSGSDELGNAAPVFTSGTTANFAENGTGTVYTAAATDADGDTPTYHLVGGADQALFDIDSSSGALTFKSAPDFETPTDSSSDNVYEVQIEARDGNGGTVTQSVAITVTNVNEIPS